MQSVKPARSPSLKALHFTSLVFLCLFLLGAAVRSIDVWRPVDHPSWRESDIASIARNYAREGMNILYPRIDWRGDGPGYAEMEFPLFPWLIATTYKLTGIQEINGRFISYFFSLGSIIVFMALARRMLPPVPAMAAVLFFVLSPLVIGISVSLQPEGLMFLMYLLAVYGFLRWLDYGKWGDFVLTTFATAMAILAKANAAHIGILFLILLLVRRGPGMLRDYRVWLFGLGSLLPPALWYWHAHGFWLEYGNSLGISSEYHWAGWDLFTDPAFITGILSLELFCSWLPSGLVLAVVGVYGRPRSAAVQTSLYWLVAISAYYLLASRTTSEEWASYYHVVSIPAVALLVGAGTEKLDSMLEQGRSAVVPAAVFLVIAAITVFYYVAPETWLPGCGTSNLVKLSLALFLIGYLALLFSSGIGTKSWRDWTIHVPGAAVYVGTGIVVILVLAAPVVLGQIRHQKVLPIRACAMEFAPEIPAGTLIVASGGRCYDEKGYQIDYNASYMFHWLDRKGWNICEEEQSVRKLMEFRDKGALYFVAEKYMLGAKQGFESELREKFKVVKECDEAVLFDLKSGAVPAK